MSGTVAADKARLVAAATKSPEKPQVTPVARSDPEPVTASTECSLDPVSEANFSAQTAYWQRTAENSVLTARGRPARPWSRSWCTVSSAKSTRLSTARPSLQRPGSWPTATVTARMSSPSSGSTSAQCVAVATRRTKTIGESSTMMQLRPSLHVTARPPGCARDDLMGHACNAQYCSLLSELHNQLDTW